MVQVEGQELPGASDHEAVQWFSCSKPSNFVRRPTHPTLRLVADRPVVRRYLVQLRLGSWTLGEV